MTTHAISRTDSEAVSDALAPVRYRRAAAPHAADGDAARARRRRSRGSAPSRRRIPGRARFLLRRVVAAVLAAIALAVTVTMLAPPEPQRMAVVVTTAPLSAGSPIPREALEVRMVLVDGVPPGALTSVEDAVGRPARIEAPAGTPLTEAMVLGPGLGDAAPPGYTVFAVELARPEDARLAEVGSTVQLVGTDPRTGEPRTIGQVLVLGISSPPAASGLVTSPTNEAERAVAYVASDDRGVSVLGGAPASGPVSVMVSP